jgi:hypothetical protein
VRCVGVGKPKKKLLRDIKRSWKQKTGQLAAAAPRRSWLRDLGDYFDRSSDRKTERAQRKSFRYRATGREFEEKKLRERYAGQIFSGWKIFFQRHTIGILIVVLTAFFLLFASNPATFAATKERVALYSQDLEVIDWTRNLFGNLNLKDIQEELAGVAEWKPQGPQYIAQEVREISISNVHIISPAGGKIYEGDSLEMMATAIVDGLEYDDSLIEFGCDFRDGEDTVVTQGVLTVSGKDTTEVIIRQNRENQRLTLICHVDPKVDVLREFESYRVYFTWVYRDFETKTRLRFYTLEQDLQTRLYELGQDPLLGLRGGDEVTYEGHAIPQCTQHCGFVDLSLNLLTELPLQEEATNYLTLALFDQTSWRGTLKHVDYMTLDIGEAASSVEFENPECLRLSSTQLQEINQQLEGDDEEYIDIDGVIVASQCKFRVTQAGNQRFPTPLTFYGATQYDYGGEGWGGVNIYDRRIEA